MLVLAVVARWSRPGRGPAPAPSTGSARFGLAAGLTALLLAITQGNAWGWARAHARGAPRWARGAGLLVDLGRGRAHPLVSTGCWPGGAMLLTNLATVFVGMGLYLRVPRPDPVRPDAAFGCRIRLFVVGAARQRGVPAAGALTGFATATASGRFIDRFGARPVLMTGAAAGVVRFTALALWHSAPWQVIVAGVATNAYISLAYGALRLVVGEAGPGRPAGHRGERDRADGGQFGGRGHRGGAARARRTRRHPVGVRVRRDLLRRGGDRRTRDGADRHDLAVPRAESPDAALDSRAMNHEWG